VVKSFLFSFFSYSVSLGLQRASSLARWQLSRAGGSVGTGVSWSFGKYVNTQEIPVGICGTDDVLASFVGSTRCRKLVIGFLTPTKQVKGLM
jgi:hypothetical protein